MKKILYMFLLLTVFGFVQPTTVMAGIDEPFPEVQISCYGLEYDTCVTAPGCYLGYFYQGQVLLMKCEECPANSYCDNGHSVHPCPDDTSSPPRSKTIEDCKVPETCAESYSEDICVSSDLGCEWSDNRCVECTSGYYCDSNPPYKHACSNGYTSDKGARTKDECKIVCTEYGTNEKWCTTAAGCYYDDTTGCHECTADHYCSPQKKEQTPCPLGAKSDKGAKGITDCYFSKITIKENYENEEREYTIDLGSDKRLYFFSTENNIIVQPAFETLEVCIPNFPCEKK